MSGLRSHPEDGSVASASGRDTILGPLGIPRAVRSETRMTDRSTKTRGAPNRPRDLNQLAACLVEESTRDDAADPVPESADEARRVRENGRLGGLKGGKVRAERLTAEKRSAIAKKAAQARWEAKTNGR